MTTLHTLRRRAATIAALALLALTAAACGSGGRAAGAAEPAAERFTLRGTIEQLAPEALVIQGITVVVDAQTAVEGAPEPGSPATVSGVLSDDGLLLARRVTVAAAASAPTSEPTAAPTAAPTSEPTAAPTSEPTAAPTSEPTAAPTVAQPAPPAARPPAPPAKPTPEPLAASEPFAALGTLIGTGVADGRVSPQAGSFLLKKYEEAQRAIADGDEKRLRDRLRDMLQFTRKEQREGRIEQSLGDQLIGTITAVGDSYGISVPGGPEERGRGKGDDD
ncbi:MAG: DUF5666 domain-containing protein [Chloroflexota bacterium]